MRGGIPSDDGCGGVTLRFEDSRRVAELTGKPRVPLPDPKRQVVWFTDRC